tara:strand:- start:638 stop:1735 length:1098 start_codon:yes stop_codon:yes gene_type:complete
MMVEDLCFFSTVPFEAARKVEILAEGHPSRGLHGHSFLAQVRAFLPQNWAPFPGSETSKLEQALTSCIAPINYSDLNTHLPVPTDENLARWIQSNADIPGIDTVGIQSTLKQGADLDKKHHAHIWKRFRFEAAHQLPNVPEGHQCGRMHGHGFEVVLHANQDLNKKNMGVDFDYIETLWNPMQQKLQYACLNDIPGLENPTSELIASWIWDQLKPKMPELSWVTVYETVTAGSHYDGKKYHIWKEQRFESAIRLMRAPKEDPRNKLFGHSYIVRLHLTSPLNEIMGWTIDYGDVKELFKPAYKKLDHRLLNDLPGIDDGDTGTVLQWIKNNMMGILPQLNRIDLFETPGSGGTLAWGSQGPILPV